MLFSKFFFQRFDGENSEKFIKNWNPKNKLGMTSAIEHFLTKEEKRKKLGWVKIINPDDFENSKTKNCFQEKSISSLQFIVLSLLLTHHPKYSSKSFVDTPFKVRSICLIKKNVCTPLYRPLYRIFLLGKVFTLYRILYSLPLPSHYTEYFIPFPSPTGIYRTSINFAYKRSTLQVIVEQARVYRCSTTVDFFEKEYTIYPPTVNDEKMYEHVKKVATDLHGSHNYRVVPPMMGAEDFSFYSEFVPTAYYYIGVRNETLGSIHTGHSPYFMIDEDMLPIGAATHATIAERYLYEYGEWEAATS